MNITTQLRDLNDSIKKKEGSFEDICKREFLKYTSSFGINWMLEDLEQDGKIKKVNGIYYSTTTKNYNYDNCKNFQPRR